MSQIVRTNYVNAILLKQILRNLLYVLSVWINLRPDTEHIFEEITAFEIPLSM